MAREENTDKYSYKEEYGGKIQYTLDHPVV